MGISYPHLMWITYVRLVSVGSVDNLSTKNVDKLDITAGFVESVDNLSTLFVDNFYLVMSVWIMWITYPQRMWITWISQLALWKVWISYPQCSWITFILLCQCG